MYIKEEIGKIFKELNVLSGLLDAIDFKEAVVSVIPPVTKEEDIDTNNLIVTPALYNGRSAVKKTAASFSDLLIQEGISQKYARRTTGVIILSNSPASQEVVELVAQVNQRKASVESYVITNYETPNARFQALREACTGLMTLHLYRAIRCYQNEAISSIRFTWQRKEVVQKVNKKELLGRLAVEIERTDGAQQKKLQTFAEAISQVPESRLRSRRPQSYQPAANIVCADRGFTVNAPIPMIVIQDEHISIKPLPIYDSVARSTRKKRSDSAPKHEIGYFCGSLYEARATER